MAGPSEAEGVDARRRELKRVPVQLARGAEERVGALKVEAGKEGLRGVFFAGRNLQRLDQRLDIQIKNLGAQNACGGDWLPVVVARPFQLLKEDRVALIIKKQTLGQPSKIAADVARRRTCTPLLPCRSEAGKADLIRMRRRESSPVDEVFPSRFMVLDREDCITQL